MISQSIAKIDTIQSEDITPESATPPAEDNAEDTIPKDTKHNAKPESVKDTVEFAPAAEDTAAYNTTYGSRTTGSCAVRTQPLLHY